jgi:NAD(P)-dependent dehydrogenase (short-subunit alcohol dehydrogenase family)
LVEIREISPMALRLEGKNALITGASDDAAIAAARRFAEEGANVFAADRSLDAARRVAAEVAAAGRKSGAMEVDVSREEQVDRMVELAAGELGGIDVLMVADAVMHARYPGAQNPSYRLIDEPLADWRRVMSYNLDAYFLTGRAAARAMIKRGKGGRIINYISVSALVASARAGDYSVSRAGAWMLTKVLALELAPHNIRVNAIAPGYLDSNMSREYYSGAPNRLEAVLKRVPLGRIGEMREIADAALFLAGDESSYFTGQVLQPNGGLLIQ